MSSPLLILLLALFGCIEESVCDRYADEVCACGDQASCDAARDLALDPSAAVQDQCEIDLPDVSCDSDAG